jgi:hypothetical protein
MRFEPGKAVKEFGERSHEPESRRQEARGRANDWPKHFAILVAFQRETPSQNTALGNSPEPSAQRRDLLAPDSSPRTPWTHRASRLYIPD